jgi:hypothetical protein
MVEDFTDLKQGKRAAVDRARELLNPGRREQRKRRRRRLLRSGKLVASRPDLAYPTSDELASILKVTPRRLFPAEWEVVYEALDQKKTNEVFFIDTEFVTCNGKPFILLEIAILDSNGICLLNETIDHGCTVQELFDRPGINNQSQKHLCNVYKVRYKSRDMAKRQTYGITIQSGRFELQPFSWIELQPT